MTCGAKEGGSTEWRSGPTPAIEVPPTTPLARCAGSSSSGGFGEDRFSLRRDWNLFDAFDDLRLADGTEFRDFRDRRGDNFAVEIRNHRFFRLRRHLGNRFDNLCFLRFNFWRARNEILDRGPDCRRAAIRTERSARLAERHRRPAHGRLPRFQMQGDLWRATRQGHWGGHFFPSRLPP